MCNCDSLTTAVRALLAECDRREKTEWPRVPTWQIREYLAPAPGLDHPAGRGEGERDV